MKIINRFAEKIIAEGESIRSAAESKKDNLSGANLRGADLRSANLRGADLRSADLFGADLRSADLSSADLFGANLSSANLCSADLSGANLSSANLCSADLSGAKYTETETLLKYFTIGPIGSRNDYLQIFITDKQTYLQTGCFRGSVESLKGRTDREDYGAALRMIEAVEKVVRG